MKCENLDGQKFGRLTVLHKEATEDRKGKRLRVVCLCECGNTVVVSKTHLKSGHTVSCGCYKREVVRKHGLGTSKVYYCWHDAKDRCTNQNNENYHLYGGRGITMSDEFIDDVSAFYEYIGDPPDDFHRWSIDRINPDMGYESGNIRWATPKEQSHNIRKLKRNTSGVTGVCRIENKKGCGWYATWVEHGKSCAKYFSIKKLGEDVAKNMAIMYRNSMIERLNEDGGGYSIFHGK